MSIQDRNSDPRPRCESPTGRCRNLALPHRRGMCQKHYRAWLRANRPVPIAAVHDHIEQLRSAGFGYRRISDLAGVGFTTARDIAHPRSTRKFVSAPVAAKLFAVTIEDRPARINPVGVGRRIEALIALGYTENRIADSLGITQSNLWKLFGGRATWVRPETFAKVDAVFRELSVLPMPEGWVAERARRRARRRGWVPPLAWDEHEIDDPAATPAQRWKPVGDHDWIEHVVDCRRLGWSDERIAADMGVEVESLMRRLDRAGLPRNHGRTAA
jgi:hypothetical protein